MRPQSAMTGFSAGSPSKMTNSFYKDQESTMRSSFYSTKGGFNDQKGGLVSSIKVKNVLELSPQDMEKIS